LILVAVRYCRKLQVGRHFDIVVAEIAYLHFALAFEESDFCDAPERVDIASFIEIASMVTAES
jgi:hypothetical protein